MSAPETPIQLRDNTDAARFEARVGEHVAFASYHPLGDALAITHTEVPEALTGQGVGSRLMRHALDEIRSRGQRVVPMCDFAAAYIRRHPEYQDMVERGHTS